VVLLLNSHYHCHAVQAQDSKQAPAHQPSSNKDPSRQWQLIHQPNYSPFRSSDFHDPNSKRTTQMTL
jgi:hypothetical protein